MAYCFTLSTLQEATMALCGQVLFILSMPTIGDSFLSHRHRHGHLAVMVEARMLLCFHGTLLIITL